MENKSISISHINIRQSISFLIVKLVVIEILISVFLFITFISLSLAELSALEINAAFISILALSKIGLTIFVVMRWLNEYYEITPIELICRKGLIFKKEQRYTFRHIMSVDLDQTFLGELFNYGTIHMYDWYINKHVYMYLIHNPKRYFLILKSLIPRVDTREEFIGGYFSSGVDDEDIVDTNEKTVISRKGGEIYVP